MGWQHNPWILGLDGQLASQDSIGKLVERNLDCALAIVGWRFPYVAVTKPAQVHVLAFEKLVNEVELSEIVKLYRCHILILMKSEAKNWNQGNCNLYNNTSICGFLAETSNLHVKILGRIVGHIGARQNLWHICGAFFAVWYCVV